jgi:hypothetical protein
VERLLRDELRRHGWEDVARVPLSGAVKTRDAYQNDVVGRPPGFGKEISFECKARAKGFEKIHGLLPPGVDRVCFSDGIRDLCVVSLDPNKVIESAVFPDITNCPPEQQKVMRSIVKKCHDWIGTAQVLALKQDRAPFLFIRYRK